MFEKSYCYVKNMLVKVKTTSHKHHKTGDMETNLADNPKYAEKLAEMEALLLEQMEENDDPYRLWDQNN